MIDWELELTGIHEAIATADAVVGAFYNQFIDGADDMNALIVGSQPRFYRYLFQAILESVQKSMKLVKELEDKADKERIEEKKSQNA